MCKVHCIRIALNQQDWKKSKKTFIQRWISSKKKYIIIITHSLYSAHCRTKPFRYPIKNYINTSNRYITSHCIQTNTLFLISIDNNTNQFHSPYKHHASENIVIFPLACTITTHHHRRRLIYIWTLARGRRLRSSGNGALFIDQPSRRRKWKMYKIYNGMCTVPGCWYCARIWSQEWGFSSVFRGSLFRVLGKVWCPRWGFGSDCSMVLIFEVFFVVAVRGWKLLGKYLSIKGLLKFGKFGSYSSNIYFLLYESLSSLINFRMFLGLFF